MSADVSADLETLPENNRRNIPLSEVRNIAPSELTINTKNAEYFDRESHVHLQHLRDDVRKRGILVPLIAKSVGTLLAGHNRLLVAQELGLKKIPVQYVQEELSEEREREFIVKDNLLRRQLSLEKRIGLYKFLYPDFEEKFLNPDELPKAGRKNTKDNSVTLEKIATETGQSVSAVRMQVKRGRDEAAKKNHHNVTISPSNESAQKNHHNVMISKEEKVLNSSTLQIFRKKLQSLHTSIQNADELEQKQMLKDLKQFLKLW